MDEPIKRRSSVPADLKPRMRRRDTPRSSPPLWHCIGWGVAGVGPTMDAAYAAWERRLLGPWR